MRSLGTAAPHTQTGVQYLHIGYPCPSPLSRRLLWRLAASFSPAVSVTGTRGDWICSEMSLKSTCSVSSVTFHIRHLHRHASNVLISLNYYSLIKTFCTRQPYSLLLQQQHLKLTSPFLKVRLKLAVNEYVPPKQ